MTEIVSTRANPMIDPTLHVWGWEIPVYLFLGGFVAGTMILGGWAVLSGQARSKRSVLTHLPALALAVLSLGMVALLLDLESKSHAWRLYTTFIPRSPMSWGAWILIGVYPLLAASVLLETPTLAAWFGPRVAAWRRAERTRRVVAAASVAIGAALGIYTGILLSALGGRPLWQSAALGPLFLLSGLSSAAAYAHFRAPSASEREAFARADLVFLALELVFVGLFFGGLLSAASAHAHAARLFFGGPYTAVFWVGVVGIGIVLPGVVQWLAVTHRVHHAPLAPILVMAGGLLLRVVIVQAGQHSHWGLG